MHFNWVFWMQRKGGGCQVGRWYLVCWHEIFDSLVMVSFMTIGVAQYYYVACGMQVRTLLLGDSHCWDPCHSTIFTLKITVVCLGTSMQ
jgi:hypothetical protein